MTCTYWKETSFRRLLYTCVVFWSTLIIVKKLGSHIKIKKMGLDINQKQVLELYTTHTNNYLPTCNGNTIAF